MHSIRQNSSQSDQTGKGQLCLANRSHRLSDLSDDLDLLDNLSHRPSILHVTKVVDLFLLCFVT